MLARHSHFLMVGTVATVSLFTGACATKKHVREAISPVQQQLTGVSGQLTDVSKKTGENTTAIGDLDRNLAKVDEQSMEAGRKATEAGRLAGAAGDAAGKANDNALLANTAAGRASQLAQQSMDQTTRLETMVGNLDNYKLLSVEKVYFNVSRYELTKEDKQKLDHAVESVSSSKSFVIEVAGFTDRTGKLSANLELSRRRAEAVVRYLTVEKNVPLRRIHDVGVGPEFPNAVNKTAAERKENRRVDVRIFMLDAQSPATQQAVAQTPKA